MLFIEQLNFHAKAFTFLLLLCLASLATVHGSLPSATPTAEILHSQSPLNKAITAETYDYTYDDAWNLSTRNAGLTNELFTVNNLNQLTGIPSGTPSYDTNGNLTSDVKGSVLVIDK